MTITKTIQGNEATITVEGWLDTQSAPQLLAEIDNLGEGITSMAMDFEKLEYISSSGVRAIVAAYKKMKGALVVRHASEGIMSIFRTTGIDKRITFQ